MTWMSSGGGGIYLQLDMHTHMQMPITERMNAMDFRSTKHKIVSGTMINDVSGGHFLNEKCHKRN